MTILRAGFGAAGPVIDLLVGVSPTRKAMLLKHGFALPAVVHLRGLLDTGAGITGVLSSVFAQLELDGPVDYIDLVTPSTHAGPVSSPLYEVSLEIAHLNQRIAFPCVSVIPFPTGDVVQAIIGRDVLNHCNFCYYGPARAFELAFDPTE